MCTGTSTMLERADHEPPIAGFSVCGDRPLEFFFGVLFSETVSFEEWTISSNDKNSNGTSNIRRMFFRFFIFGPFVEDLFLS